MILVDNLLRIAMILIMLTIGISLRLQDFKEIFKKPKNLIVGLVSQILLLPALALLVLQFFDIPLGLKIGVLVLSISPGGTTSNLVSYLIKGRTSLSVSLTAANTAIILFSIPFFLKIIIDSYYGQSLSSQIGFASIISELFLVIAIPVIIGLLIKEKMPHFANVAEKWSRRISLAFLATVFLIKFLSPVSQGGSKITLENVYLVLPILLIFHLASLYMGFFNSKASGADNKTSITVGIETGLQNTALALLISETIIGIDLITHPALIYGLFSFFTTALFGILMKRKLVKNESSFRV